MNVIEHDLTLILDSIRVFLEKYQFWAKMAGKSSEKYWHQRKIEARPILLLLCEVYSIYLIPTKFQQQKQTPFFCFKASIFK